MDAKRWATAFQSLGWKFRLMQRCVAAKETDTTRVDGQTLANLRLPRPPTFSQKFAHKR